MTDVPGFREWLAAQAGRRDAVGTFARQIAAGQVRLGASDLAVTRSLRTNARVAYEKSLHSPTKRAPQSPKPSQPKAPATRQTGVCPGCKRTTDELVVDDKSSGRSSLTVWHRSCHQKNRGRSGGRGLRKAVDG